MSDALVLAGAAAKGAFTGGALSVLSDPATKVRLGVDVQRIVGASSGALNGLYYAFHLRAGTEAALGPGLLQLWLDDATVLGSFNLSLPDLLHLRGVSGDQKLLDLMSRNVKPTAGRNPIELRLVVTNADGEQAAVAGTPATTYEHVIDIAGEDFDTADSLTRVFTATAASCAFPGVYAPVAVDIGGRTVRCMDGGVVDDAPLGHALAGAPAIDRVFVVTPFPRLRSEPPAMEGLGLALHVFDMLIEERLFRDLRRTARVNDVLARLPTLVADASERAAVIEALGWTGRRPVQVIEIRPDGDLPGDSFSGLRSRALRQQYLDAGVDRARKVLGALPPVG